MTPSMTTILGEPYLGFPFNTLVLILTLISAYQKIPQYLGSPRLIHTQRRGRICLLKFLQCNPISVYPLSSMELTPWKVLSGVASLVIHLFSSPQSAQSTQNISYSIPILLHPSFPLRPLATRICFARPSSMPPPTSFSFFVAQKVKNGKRSSMLFKKRFTSCGYFIMFPPRHQLWSNRPQNYF